LAPSKSRPADRPIRAFQDINDNSDDPDYQAPLNEEVDDDDEEVDDEDEEEERQPTSTKRQSRSRRAPERTGYVLEPACDKCYLADRLCLEDKGGGSCVDCKRLKYKCDYAAGGKKKKDIVVPKRRKLTQKQLSRLKEEEDDEMTEEKLQKEKKAKSSRQEVTKPREKKKGQKKGKEKFDTDDECEELVSYRGDQKYVEISDDDGVGQASVTKPGPSKPAPAPKKRASVKAKGKEKSAKPVDTPEAYAAPDLSHLVTKGIVN
jgi:hypothetical protein